MSYLDKLEEEMKASGDEPVCIGGFRDVDIKALEDGLGVKFPPSYKEFLRKFGALSFAGDTYYGITEKILAATSVPSVLFAKKKLGRKAMRTKVWSSLSHQGMGQFTQ